MIIDYPYSGNEKILLRVPPFLDILNIRMALYVDRFLEAELVTIPPVVFLKSLLHELDTDELLTVDNDTMLDMVRTYIPRVAHKFDFITLRKTLDRSWFFDHDVKEYIMPTSGLIGSTVSHIDGWSRWDDIKTIKLMYVNSNELNLEDYGNIFRYKNDKPSMAVIGIDIAALLLKYIVYLKEYDLKLGDSEATQLFCRDQVALMFADRLEVWITNWLNAIMEDELDTVSIIGSYSSSQYDKATEEIQDLVQRLGHGSVKLADMFLTKFYGDMNFTDISSTYMDTYNPGFGRRRIAANILQQLGIGNIYINLLSHAEQKRTTTQLIRRLQVEYRRIMRSGWDRMIPDAVTKLEVNSFINSIQLLTLTSV